MGTGSKLIPGTLGAALLLTSLMQTGCNSTKEFWRYVVDKEVSKPLAERETGTVDTPRLLSPHNVKVVLTRRL